MYFASSEAVVVSWSNRNFENGNTQIVEGEAKPAGQWQIYTHSLYLVNLTMFIPKVLDGVQITPVPHQTGKTFSLSTFVHSGIVMWSRNVFFLISCHKVRRTLSSKISVCCSINLSQEKQARPNVCHKACGPHTLGHIVFNPAPLTCQICISVSVHTLLITQNPI